MFDALLPYIEIFDNGFISFSDLCQEQSLIIRDLTNTENSDKNALELDNLMKKIKLSEGAY